jgi:amidase/aspartyl-tRNA(Asn)/glutamyl-tRNA(Gln) amidotransferase subunit A
MRPDLTQAAADVTAGRESAAARLEISLAAADAPANARALIRRFDAQARAAAAAVDAARLTGAPVPPLAGLAVSVKDLFDVAGQPTTAGSRSLRDAAPAAADSVAVARLRYAGAALLGHSNLSEFAYSGVGLNPHHGTPANPATAALDTQPRIPGGSTSGGAVSVAAGAAWAALGSDTGGSLRIPAALQGLVGFKSTARLVPTDGCIPLSPTLDTAGAITVSVRDAVILHTVLADRTPRLRGRPVTALRLAVPRTTLLDGLDSEVARTFEDTLRQLRDAGALIVEIELPSLAEVATLQAGGGFAAVESWAWHRRRLADHEADYDPRVAARIRRGQALSAADYIDLQRARDHWIRGLEAALAPYDALLSPTVPIVAPPIEPLLRNDEAFFATNALLLRNPSVVNLLDGCALSLPCHAPGDWPVGLMVWGPALSDDTVLDVALAVETCLAHRRGG